MRIVVEFLGSVKGLYQTSDTRCIINIDEISVCIDMPHRRTIHTKGDETIDMVTFGN